MVNNSELAVIASSKVLIQSVFTHAIQVISNPDGKTGMYVGSINSGGNDLHLINIDDPTGAIQVISGFNFVRALALDSALSQPPSPEPEPSRGLNTNANGLFSQRPGLH